MFDTIVLGTAILTCDTSMTLRIDICNSVYGFSMPSQSYPNATISASQYYTVKTMYTFNTVSL